MAINEELDKYLSAFRAVESASLEILLSRSKSHIERLEQDVKVLRWALYQAREALLQSHGQANSGVLSLIETAQSMTEPANDR